MSILSEKLIRTIEKAIEEKSSRSEIVETFEPIIREMIDIENARFLRLIVSCVYGGDMHQMMNDSAKILLFIDNLEVTDKDRKIFMKVLLRRTKGHISNAYYAIVDGLPKKHSQPEDEEIYRY